MKVAEVLTMIEEQSWSHWIRQVRSIFRLELKRHFFSRRSMFVFLLASAPVVLFGITNLLPIEQRIVDTLGGMNVLYAAEFRSFFLRFVVFFGCVGVFMRLFRGDVLERTLHYYFLVPVRRDVLVIGKYLAGLFTVLVPFLISVILSFLFMLLPSGSAMVEEFLLKGPGMGHLLAYLGVTLLACMGYGAVFILLGMLFKNPIVPAGAMLGWESINFLLPPVLKKISVIYYLESLCPVPIPEGPITLLAEPAPFWLAVPGIVILTVFLLLVSSFRARQMEILYGE
jgi:ABC-type transport system involved in multi-copper enzyme maturation permease subunit